MHDAYILQMGEFFGHCMIAIDLNGDRYVRVYVCVHVCVCTCA